MKNKKPSKKPYKGKISGKAPSKPKAPPRSKAQAKPAQKPAPKLKIDLYGGHAVLAALQNPEREIHQLYLTENASHNFEIPQQFSPTTVDKKALDRALPEGAVHQGIGLMTAPLPELFIEDIIIRSENQSTTTLLILDQVTDPHNVGAILRSACAFNAQGLIMQKRHAPDLTGVLAKTACGAVEHVPVIYETNLTRSLETLKEAGFFVYGLDERGEDISDLQDLPTKRVLVLGAEGPGIRRLVKDSCDTLLRLPMNGAMPSINVSNAAAVALYAISASS